jgi:hypothetical protein
VAAIDRFLPTFDVSEVHGVDLQVRPDRAVEAALAAPAVPDAIVRLLFRVRGLSAVGSIEEAFTRMGFEVLERSPAEVVVGSSGTPWRPRGGTRSFSDAAPGTVRIAASFSAEPSAAGCRLTTETRVAAADESARRAFRRYWRVVGPFSALIRRRWLAAVSRSVAAADSGRL